MYKVPNNSIKKVAIMGLDNSGKTSIVLCLKGVKNLLSFYSLNPTKGIKIDEFETLGTKFNIWDFGGQEQFRNDYLLNFNEHIKGTDKIIFVIDIQDIERYDLALDFLKKILDLLIRIKNKIEFSIFLHKYDPDLELVNKKFNYKKAEKLVIDIKKVIPSNFLFTIEKSSIYTIFQKSAID
ncbi:MAG: ADP-ribosylation factor-like protein [Candidatus Hodarchaeota archaeon]